MGLVDPAVGEPVAALEISDLEALAYEVTTEACTSVSCEQERKG